jgi:hypothetical protein
VADKVVEEPAQILAVEGVTATVGTGTTLTVATAVLVQIPLAPVIVYVVVVAGDATTIARFALLRPVAGVQV